MPDLSVVDSQPLPQGGDLSVVKSDPLPGKPGFLSTLWNEAVVNPARQVAAGFEGAAASANHLTANTFDLLDKAADGLASATGTTKGGAFKQIADWARGNQAAQEREAQQLAGGRTDLPSTLYRGGTQGLASLPTAAIAAHVGGPIAGFAALGAIQESDQGWLPALKAAAEGGLMGAALQVMGPASRPIRLTGAAAMTYAQARLDGADNNTALAQATTMGLVAGRPAGGASAREIGLIPEFRSNLNPVQQGAVDFLRSEAVPLKAGTITGNRFLKTAEAVTASSPLGTLQASDFARATEQGLTRVAGNLAEQASPTPATAESVGARAARGLQDVIAERQVARDAAYVKAWEGRNDPAQTVSVPVRTQQNKIFDQVGRDTGRTETVPVYEDVNMPVDVRDLKAQAQPVYQEMLWTLTPAEQSASAGFNAVRRLIDSDDYVPAWQAEHALSGLKSMARTTTNSGVRNTSQGIAASLIPDLQRGIDAAVYKSGGQEALEGLQNGRAIHADVMDVADIADKLRSEPVQAFNQLTWGKDTGISYLRRIEEQTPDLMPQIGRAYAEQLFQQATQEGGFQRAAGILRQWENLGPETKKLLYPNPALRQSLDNFFLGAKAVAENVNPSGTAIVQQATSLNPLRWLAGWAGGKLLFTPGGIRLLTGAVQNPPTNPGAGALLRSQASRIAGPPGGAAGDEPGGPPPPPPGGGGAPPGAGGGAGTIPPEGPAQASTPPGARTQWTSSGPREPQWLRDARARSQGVNPNNETTNPPATGAQPNIPGAPGAVTPGDSQTILRVNGSDRTYPATYKVIELKDLKTSHNGFNFNPNPEYELANERDYTKPENQAKIVNAATPTRFDPRYMITDVPSATDGPPVVDTAGNAIGGNGRGMILQRVYSLSPTAAKAYRDLLTQQAAHYGIDRATIAGMREPVLVREIPDSEGFDTAAKQGLVTESNAKGTAELRPAERAVSDSRRIGATTLDDIGGRLEAKGPDSTLAEVLEGKSGVEVLARLVDDGVVNPNDAAALSNGKELTPEGKLRVQRTLLGRFFRDPQQIDRTPPSIIGKVTRIAAPAARTEAEGEWSLTPKIQAAMDLLEGARAHGLANLDDAVKQSGLFGGYQYPPDVVNLAKHLRADTATDLTKAVRLYAQDARFAREGNGLFGNAPTQAEAFDAAFPETGPHGPIFRDFHHDAPGAIAKLVQQQSGEAIGALHHSAVGDIDLVWGKPGRPWQSGDDGYGLAHILAKHGDEFDVNNLQKMLDDMQKKPSTEADRVELESPRYHATVRLSWDHTAKRWLLTAFDQTKPPPAKGRSFVPGTP
jgi:ddrB-like ParB superfamily domain/phage-Barnase-EndoU-ColicinE5/D-RelE like nuclease1